MTIKLITVLALMLVLAGCAREDNVTEYTVEKAAPKAEDASSEHDHAHEPAATGIHWSLPKGWKEVESTSSMRLASVVIESVEGSDLSLTKFPGDAGGTVANINRWRGQVGLAQATPEEIMAALVTGKSPIGEYKYAALVNPENEKTAFLAAILPYGNSTVFIKLSLPASAVEGVTPDFVSFCNSLHAAGPGHSH